MYAHIHHIDYAYEQDREGRYKHPRLVHAMDNGDAEGVADYLSQWDYGSWGNNIYGIYTESKAVVHKSTRIPLDDTTEYVVSFDTRLGYAKLEVYSEELRYHNGAPQTA